MRDWDAIVVGVGSMGASACMHLATRGARVLGLERFGIAHEYGSHHGGSRIIRDCYFEGPKYVPLLLRCAEQWRQLEIAAPSLEGPLVHRPGVLYLGPSGSEVVARSGGSGLLHGVPCETLAAKELRARYPQFFVDESWSGLFEPGAGFVRPERAVRAFAQVARARGAELREHEQVLGWSEDHDGVRVETDQAVYRAKTLLLTAGAWSPAVARGLGVTLTPQRVVIAWLTPCDPEWCAAPRMPVWYIDRGSGLPGIYGIPTATDQGAPLGVKVALHGNGTACDPEAVRAAPTAVELEEIRALTERFVPCAGGAVIASSTCMYTMSPDADFIVDRMPGCARTVVAAGFSGHGFKFAPVIGEALADFALSGTSAAPIEFLRLARFA